jgi:hypothetical protein
LQQQRMEAAAQAEAVGHPDEAQQQQGEAGGEGDDAPPSDAPQQQGNGSGDGQPEGPAADPSQQDWQEGQPAASPAASATAAVETAFSDSTSSSDNGGGGASGSEEPGSEPALSTPEPASVDAAGSGSYRPSLPARQLRRGIVSQGDPGRARRAAAKLLSGEPVAVAFVGGSVTL